jgi:lactate permease
LVGGGSFGAIQFLLSNFHGPTAVDVVGGVGSLSILALFLRFWRPKKIWTLPEDSTEAAASEPPSLAVAWRAWLPWALLSLLVFVWALKPMKERLQQVAGATVEVPALHNVVVRGSEVAAKATPEKAEYAFQPFAAAGTAIFAAAVLSAIWLRVSLRAFARVWFATLVGVGEALVTIVMMLALAHVTKYCGSDATLGLAFTHAGWLYPFFAPLLGWLGVALTGSDTASNALFGGLQKITAEKLGLDPILIAASNSTGGVMGKMIDAQSIVVAAAATGQHRQEGAILRFVFVHSVVLAALVGLLTMLQATALRGMVPAVGH